MTADGTLCVRVDVDDEGRGWGKRVRRSQAAAARQQASRGRVKRWGWAAFAPKALRASPKHSRRRAPAH
jgi:hypothetical protein